MNPVWTLDRWAQTLPRIIHELYTLTADLVGQISGEHGIGHKRKDALPMFLSPAAIDMTRAVKRALDPNGILNPGKLFPS